MTKSERAHPLSTTIKWLVSHVLANLVASNQGLIANVLRRINSLVCHAQRKLGRNCNVTAENLPSSKPAGDLQGPTETNPLA